MQIPSPVHARPRRAPAAIGGNVAPGFEEVRAEFERNFAGAGGSFGFADPDARVGYGYVMNKLDFHLVDDPREKALRDAIYRAIARTV